MPAGGREFCVPNSRSLKEGLEAGAEVLLIDEDTSASNFMNRDEKMQQLVGKEYDPVTTFIDRVRQLYEEARVIILI